MSKLKLFIQLYFVIILVLIVQQIDGATVTCPAGFEYTQSDSKCHSVGSHVDECPSLATGVSYVNTTTIFKPSSIIGNPPENGYCNSIGGDYVTDCTISCPLDCTDPPRAIDGDVSTAWNPGTLVGFNYANYWLEIQYPTYIKPNDFYIVLPGDTTHDRNTFTIKATNTSQSNYVAITTIITTLGLTGYRNYSISTDVAAKYWYVGFEARTYQVYVLEIGFQTNKPLCDSFYPPIPPPPIPISDANSECALPSLVWMVPI